MRRNAIQRNIETRELYVDTVRTQTEMTVVQNQILNDGIKRIGDVLEKFALREDNNAMEDVKKNINNLYTMMGNIDEKLNLLVASINNQSNPPPN